MSDEFERNRFRIVMAKPGLDGHDRGVKVVARALRDAGMEVIYGGLHQSPEAIVQMVMQEDADVLGLSVLSGAHVALVRRLVALLKDNDATDVSLMVGGTIPESDIATLHDLGVERVFTPGTPMRDIVEFVASVQARKTH
jgi:methylmalonyl-CoA mutase C-terminal domain/subunit